MEQPNLLLLQGAGLRYTAITMDTFTLRSEEQLAASTRITQSTYLRYLGSTFIEIEVHH
jgi:hypothetical protein